MRKTVGLILALAFLVTAIGCVFADEVQWHCENCGAEMTGKFCMACGASRPEPAATPEPPDTDSTEWLCDNCGAKMTGKFCISCGAKRPDPQAAPEPPDTVNAGWHCENCGAEMTGKFCTACGAKKPESETLPEPSAAPEPAVTPEPEPAGWTCPACGAEYPEDYLFCPKDGTRQDKAKQPESGGREPAASVPKWPEIPMDGINVKLTALDKDNRHQSYFGPDRKKYPGSGAFVPRNVRAVTALFQEGGFILTDLDYPAVGRRCVYFMPYSIKNTSGREIPVVTLTAYPAEVTESVQPAYGPGEVYDVLKKAETAKNGQMMYRKVILEAGTEINVFFEMNGWAHAEFQCALGLVRAWVPADCVR